MRMNHLRVDHLRTLELDARQHPRGLPHLSAASGLVCVLGQAYVIGDDELHVAAFHDRTSKGLLHRVAKGDLPRDPAKRKKRKRDFETLLWWPQGRALIGLGSGSRPQRRDRAFMLELDAAGAPRGAARSIDLEPLYEPLRERFGAINIEGAFVAADELRLVNRGQGEGAGNLVLSWRLDDIVDLIAGRSRSRPRLQSTQAFDLGSLDGVALGFTDAAAVPGGRGSWLYSAVAEATDNSFDDGACHGTVIGLASASARVRWQRRLEGREKVEGIDVQRDGRDLAIFMTTDADDPAQPSWLLSTRVRA